jgi:hypothetical protein
MSADTVAPGAVVPWTLPQVEMVEQMTHCVEELLQNKKKRKRAIAAAERTAARYSIDNMVDFYLTHVEEVCMGYANR